MRAVPVLLVALIALAGCAEIVAKKQRCDYLNERVSACFGDDLGPIACDGVSERDLETLIGALDRSACALFADTLPTDGDLNASSCRVFGDGCVDAINPLPARRAARYPILLVNGIDTSPAFRYSERIVETMRAEGHTVLLATLTPYEPPSRRAHELWERIQRAKEETGAEKVNLVCHSLGGLDCRYVASPGGLHWEIDETHEAIVSSIASVTTFSTAHRGTRAADAALGYLPDYGEDEGLNALATWLGEWFSRRTFERDVALREAIAALTSDQAAAFNLQVPDADGVYYQSWAGFSRPYGFASDDYDAQLAELCRADEGDGLALFRGDHDFMALALIPSSDIVARPSRDRDVDVPNDGLVAVESARWGNFRGCVPADHMEQLGQRALPDVNVRTGIDIANFYSTLASDLAARGL